ncbi:hypothetical protein DdX_16489 [Ditylenchus destructor]|uniref:Uncharacterized protein n=1 Tax=Ditylenchus destructor TaxID=166010 RepID=A0AAD4MNS1_9BILA|nr:hypothetical protein DdX_16489 [Ditylenchus destructor]
MDCGEAAKKNVDHAPHQAFEVNSLSMEKIVCRRNSIISFEQGIQSADAVRKWFQDHSLCDDTSEIPLEKVSAGMNLFDPIHILHVTIRAFFEEPREKNMPLTGKGQHMDRCFSNANLMLHSKPPVLFSAKFNAKYEFYGAILSYFFRLLYHPAAYFREVSIFPPMTDKFCDEVSKNLIRCDRFTLHHLDSSWEHSLKWLKDNVRAKQVILPFNYNHAMPSSDLHSLISEFLLQNASICAKDRVTLDWLRHPRKFVSAMIKKYETLEVTKTIPSILIEDCPSNVQQCFESSLVSQDDPPLYDKRCDNVKTYQIHNKLDVNRKMIAQFRRCSKRNCLYYGSIFHMRFE